MCYFFSKMGLNLPRASVVQKNFKLAIARYKGRKWGNETRDGSGEGREGKGRGVGKGEGKGRDTPSFNNRFTPLVSRESG